MYVVWWGDDDLRMCEEGVVGRGVFEDEEEMAGLCTCRCEVTRDSNNCVGGGHIVGNLLLGIYCWELSCGMRVRFDGVVGLSERLCKCTYGFGIVRVDAYQLYCIVLIK